MLLFGCLDLTVDHRMTRPGREASSEAQQGERGRDPVEFGMPAVARLMWEMLIDEDLADEPAALLVHLHRFIPVAEERFRRRFERRS